MAINVENEYINACKKSTRKGYTTIKLIRDVDNDIIDKINMQNLTIPNKWEFSQVETLFLRSIDKTANYVTCEPNRVKLDGSFEILRDKTKSNNLQVVPFMSKLISNENGRFISNRPTITIRLKEPSEAYGFILTFQEVCTDISVSYYDTNKSQNAIVFQNITNNNDLEVYSNEEINSHSGESFNQIRLAFNATKLPYRNIKLNHIQLGDYAILNENDINNFTLIKETDINNEDLISSTLNVDIKDEKGIYDPLNPNNNIKRLFDIRNVCLYYNLYVNGEYQKLLIGTYILNKLNFQDKIVTLEASDIFYTDKENYYSPFYGYDITAEEVINDFFEYYGISNYELKDFDLAQDGTDSMNMPTYANSISRCYIPLVSFKEALRMILQTFGCILYFKNNGQPIIQYVGTNYKGNSENISNSFNRNDIFSEKNEFVPQYNKITITKHNFNWEINQEKEEVFNGSLSRGINTISYNNVPAVSMEYNSSHYEFVFKDKDDNVLNNDTNQIATYLNFYATGCVLNILVDEVKLELKAIIAKDGNIAIDFENQNENIVKSDDTLVLDESNTLITNSNIDFLADYFINKSQIHYSFDSKLFPYIEVGDKCSYLTRYNEEKNILITKIEITNSIIENFEGEEII